MSTRAYTNNRNDAPVPNLIDRYEWVDAVQNSDLGPRERHLCLVLAQHRNHETGRCDPGYRRLARLMGCSKNTVQRAVSACASADFLTVTKRPDGSFGYDFRTPDCPPVRDRGVPTGRTESTSNPLPGREGGKGAGARELDAQPASARGAYWEPTR